MNDVEHDIEKIRFSRTASVFSAVGLVVSWSLILLLGFHVLGAMGMLLLPDAGLWTASTAWIGCGTVLVASTLAEPRRRDRLMLFGSTLLMALVLIAIANGAVLSVLATAWPFAILWYRIAHRVWRNREPPAWQDVARTKR